MSFLPDMRAVRLSPIRSDLRASVPSINQEFNMVSGMTGFKVGVVRIALMNRAAGARSFILRNGSGGTALASFIAVNNQFLDFKPLGPLILGDGFPPILFSPENATAGGSVDIELESILIPAV